ncbi:hypothetical protein MtrunA17_Chr7g0220361 [Medicago truncatula]|uniref:Uncharacterized protein n=1 Tax=Medicago truncatula TaxID=3880 RepID=A0A396GTQ9_MEDTR|nr:hypothetical protein MtrunA17_Chr7g0220361 [Medicago truncatula]
MFHLRFHFLRDQVNKDGQNMKIVSMSCIRILFPNERQLYDGVSRKSTFVSYDLSFSEEVYRGMIIQLLKFSDSFANKALQHGVCSKSSTCSRHCDLTHEFESLFLYSLVIGSNKNQE